MRIDKKLVAKLLDIDEAEIARLGGLSFKLDAPSNTFETLLDERQRRRLESLSAALRNEDDLGKVVRAQIHIEHELQDFIFFAAPVPDQLKSFDTMEFTDKVQLALLLGLTPDLNAALNATGRLRNKFAHRLDMKIGEDEVKNLIATLTPSAKQHFQARLNDALSELPENAALAGEALVYLNTQIRVSVFFLQLFDQVSRERYRVALEKIQQMAGQQRAATNVSRSVKK
jgi:hypothetical protein